MTEARCKTCGRLFILAPEHAFRDNRGAYCKPTCWLHRNDKKTKSKGRPTLKVEQYTKEGVLLKTYESTKQASSETGFYYQSLARACRHRELYRGYLWRYVEEKER